MPVVRLLLALACSMALGACATTLRRAEPEATPFPARDELAQLEAAPPPGDFADVGEELQRWELAGPLAEEVAVRPANYRDSWGRLLAAAVEKRPGVVVATDALDCVAREYGRVLLARQRAPSSRFLEFVAARCGTAAADLVVNQFGGDVPADIPEEEVFEHYRRGAEAWIEQAVVGTNLSVGRWFGRAGDRALLVVARGRRLLHLEPTRMRVAPGEAVILRGEMLEPTEHLRAVINQGAYGTSTCESDPDVAPPRFSFRCTPAPDDAWAWVEIHTLPPGRMLFQVAGLFVATAQSELPDVYEQATLVASSVGTALQQPEAKLVHLVNAVRVQAGQSTLRHASEQSATAARVAPHYFAAASGKGRAIDMDTVALGIQAGWDVPQPIMSGAFVAKGIAASEDVEGLVALMVERPGSRQILLSPKNDALAVGLLEAKESGMLGAVVGTYDLFEPTSHEEAHAAVVTRLLAERRKHGQEKLALLTPAAGLAADAAAQVQGGAHAEDVLAQLVRRSVNTLGRQVHGWRLEAHDLDEIEFPDAVLKDPRLGVAIGVAPVQPVGAPWVRWVIFLVTAESRVHL